MINFNLFSVFLSLKIHRHIGLQGGALKNDFLPFLAMIFICLEENLHLCRAISSKTGVCQESPLHEPYGARYSWHFIQTTSLYTWVLLNIYKIIFFSRVFCSEKEDNGLLNTLVSKVFQKHFLIRWFRNFEDLHWVLLNSIECSNDSTNCNLLKG